MSESFESVPPFVRSPEIGRRSFASPTTLEWVKHSSLLVVTFLSMTFAGLVMAAPADIDVPEPVVSGVLGYVLYIPQYYVAIITSLLSFAASHPSVLIEGLTFSLALLVILTAHEMGHYLACRYYGVSATLPFFIPAPPLFLAGTFGAFIKMRSPIPSRHALFDIGLAGPLAGFVALLPIGFVGVLSLQPAPPIVGDSVIYFNDPLLFRAIAGVNGISLSNVLPNPLYMAAWIGLLVTSLNLMPVGQLDGGHGTFALFGQHAHKRIGLISFVTMAVIAVLGFVWYSSPSGFLYTILLAVMLKVRHPAPEVWEPLGARRTTVAIITLIVFALSFWPFPVTIG